MYIHICYLLILQSHFTAPVFQSEIKGMTLTQEISITLFEGGMNHAILMVCSFKVLVWFVHYADNHERVQDFSLFSDSVICSFH
jgi:hypothetical protein